MTNLELFNFIYAIEPENDKQKKLLNKIMNLIVEDKTGIVNGKTKERTKYNLSESIEAFLDTINKNDLCDVPTENIYLDYLDFCRKNKFKPKTKAMLSRGVCDVFGIKTKVKSINNKCIRVYM